MRRVLLQGFYGVHNLGDDYILYSILNTIERVKECQVLIYSQGDEYQELLKKFSPNKYQIQKLQEINFLRKLKDISSSTHWIIGGGGLFPKENLISSLSYLIKVLYARVHNVRVIIYGVEFNSFNNKLNTFIWKIIFKNIDAVWVRNHNNENMIKKMNISNVYGSSDVTFSLSTNLEQRRGDSEFIKDNLLENYIVWALAMPWRKDELNEPHVKSRYEKLCKMLVDSINKLNQYQHVLLPFYCGMDVDFVNDIKGRLDIENVVIFPDDNSYDIDEKRYIFSKCTMAVCMRFHSVIFSLYHSVPFCAISYSPKTSSVLEEVTMEDRMVALGIRKEDFFYQEFDVDADAFNALINRTLQNITNENYIRRSNEVANILKQKAKAAEKVIITWIKS